MGYAVRAMKVFRRYRALALGYITAVAALTLLAVLPGPVLAGVVIGKAYPDGPAIILTPPEESPITDAPAEPPPLPRVKPERPKPIEQKAKAKEPAVKKAEQKKTPARKAEQKKAPAKTQAAPPEQSKQCDYCYGCLSASHDCRRQWTCGKRYREVVVLGLCRR